jgi:type IV secretory pathway VirB2 component (pilin)
MKINSKQLFKISLTTSFVLVLYPILSSNLDIVQAYAQAATDPNLDATANLSSNALTRVMCNALRIVTGGAGKTFATFAVIATGIGFFTGKVSWGLMIGVAAGIATMFGGPSIVAAISGENTETMCTGIN